MATFKWILRIIILVSNGSNLCPEITHNKVTAMKARSSDDYCTPRRILALLLQHSHIYIYIAIYFLSTKTIIIKKTVIVAAQKIGER